MPVYHLSDRALVRLSGDDAEELLQRLITTDLEDVPEGQAGYGALLAPQGKILFDFLLVREPDAFLFDLDRSISDAFVKKMTLYRMRSDVTIDPLADHVGLSLEPHAGAVRDPRSQDLGWRLYGSGEGWESADAIGEDYLRRHIEACIPQAGLDFSYGDAFPHDINMDFLGGLDFKKGCYVGQEVVSRMQHRGTARRRLVRIEVRGADGGALPPTGSEIRAGERLIGTLGAVCGTQALALVRMDRLEDAEKDNLVLQAGDVQVSVIAPLYFDIND